MRYQFRRPPQRERYVRDLERAGPRGRRAMLIPCGHDLGRRRRCLARSRQLSRVVASDHRRAHGSADGNCRRGARARNAWLGGRHGGPQPVVSSVDRRDRRAREAGRRSNNHRADRQRRLLSNPIRRPRARRVGLDCRAEAEHDRTHRSPEVIVARTALVDPRRSRAAAARASDLYLHGYILGDPAPRPSQESRWSWAERLEEEIGRA